MIEQERSAYIELEKLMTAKTILYYGAMKMRITGLDIRGGRMFITLEESNGNTHDFDNLIADVPSFISRIRLTPIVEDKSNMIFFDKLARIYKKNLDYDIVSVWKDKGTAKALVFSISFSESDFLKNNPKLSFAKQEGENKAIYLYPDSVNGSMVSLRTKDRVGVYLGPFNVHVSAKSYTMEMVILNGKETLKLLPKI